MDQEYSDDVFSQILDTAEAARFLKMKPRTLRQPEWRQRVGLKSFKFGGSRRYKLSDLIEFLESQESIVE